MAYHPPKAGSFAFTRLSLLRFTWGSMGGSVRALRWNGDVSGGGECPGLTLVSSSWTSRGSTPFAEIDRFRVLHPSKWSIILGTFGLLGASRGPNCEERDRSERIRPRSGSPLWIGIAQRSEVRASGRRSGGPPCHYLKL